MSPKDRCSRSPCHTLTHTCMVAGPLLYTRVKCIWGAPHVVQERKMRRAFQKSLSVCFLFIAPWLGVVKADYFECDDADCGANCSSNGCAEACTGNGCGAGCNGNYCAEFCGSDNCGKMCTADSCAKFCTGNGCGAGCVGKNCAKLCNGDYCGQMCTGLRCAENCGKSDEEQCGFACAGVECAFNCDGVLCGQLCTGTNCASYCMDGYCGAGCIGKDCASGCSGDNCGRGCFHTPSNNCTSEENTVPTVEMGQSCSALAALYNTHGENISEFSCDIANHPAAWAVFNESMPPDVTPCFSKKLDDSSESSDRSCTETSDGFPPLMCATLSEPCDDPDLASCSAARPCFQCQGRCTDDSECADGLSCHIRTPENGLTVPGCSTDAAPDLIAGANAFGFCTSGAVLKTPKEENQNRTGLIIGVSIVTLIGVFLLFWKWNVLQKIRDLCSQKEDNTSYAGFL